MIKIKIALHIIIIMNVGTRPLWVINNLAMGQRGGGCVTGEEQ